MDEVEISLRDYGAQLEQLCPQITLADLQQVNWEESMTSTETESVGELLDPHLSEPERNLWRLRVLIAAASAIAALVLAVALLPGDDDAAPVITDVPSSTSIVVEPTVDRREQQNVLATVSGESVADSVVRLSATDSEAFFEVETSGLTPGHAMTVWLHVVNVDACRELLPAVLGRSCDPRLILDNPEIGNLGYLGGGVVDDAGGFRLEAGITSEGIPKQWFDTPIESFLRANLQITVRDHGPVIEDLVDELTGSYRGGCTDASVYTNAPPRAFADGAPGDFRCLDRQIAGLRLEE